MGCLSTARIEYPNEVDTNVTTENCTFIEISKILGGGGGGGGGGGNYLHPHKRSPTNLFFLISNPGLYSTNWFQLRFKDGAYYCYCAYVLRISRYLDFLSPMLTNSGIFFRGLKLSGESRS